MPTVREGEYTFMEKALSLKLLSRIPTHTAVYHAQALRSRKGIDCIQGLQSGKDINTVHDKLQVMSRTVTRTHCFAANSTHHAKVRKRAP